MSGDRSIRVELDTFSGPDEEVPAEIDEDLANVHVSWKDVDDMPGFESTTELHRKSSVTVEGPGSNRGTHGKLKELPGSIYHTIRFTDDANEVTKWVWSKERRQHVDNYRCKAYISFTESVGNLTALLLACLHNRPGAIQTLLAAEAEIAERDDRGRSALHCLCASQSDKTIHKAFEMIMSRLHMASVPACELVNARESKMGRTPVMEACLMGRNSAIIQLCNTPYLQADLKLRDDEGMTALHHICCSHADMEAFNTVLDKSDIDAQDRQGRTPFLVACENNKSDKAKRLLDAGTDLYVRDNDQKNALHYLSAVEGENIKELLGVISKRVAMKARFSVAVESTDGPVATARQFSNQRDSRGLSPLQIALKKRRIDNAKILIANKADFNFRMDDGRLPLQYACDSKYPHIDLAIVLVKHGADISMRLEDHSTLDQYSCSLLHYACRKDRVELVECLLQRGADVMDRDSLNQRPFYYVQSFGVHRQLIKAGAIDTGERVPWLLDENCRKGNSERAIYMIQHIKSSYVTYKHLKNAVRYNYQSIAMALIQHRHWYKFLRHTFHGDQGELTTPFRELIKKMPEVAEVMLNKCMVSDPRFKDPGDSNYSIIMNYEFLEDFSLPKQTSENEYDEAMEARTKLREQFRADLPEFAGHDCSYEALHVVEPKHFSTKWGPTGFQKETHPLSIMVHHDRTNLLSHPLVSSLLHYKWNKFGRYGYYGNCTVYCVLLLFLTAYTFVIPNPLSERCINQTSVGENTDLAHCDLSIPRETFLIAAACVVIIISILRLIFESTQLLISRSFFFTWFYKVGLYSFSIIYVFFFFNSPCGCLLAWQWEIGILATFMAWMNLVFFISKFPQIGIYVIMLSSVFITFLKVVLLFSLLVIAFSISFYMAFREPAITRSPFSTPGRTLLKMVTMTTGEFDFDDTFRQSPNGDSDSEEEISFVVISSIMWVFFVIIMPVLFTNVLVGLAVGDIENIQKGAALKKLALQVDLVLAVESVYRRWPLKKVLTIAWKKLWPNSPVTSRNNFSVLKWSKRKLFLMKLLDKIQFSEWGGDRYDSIRNITAALNTTHVHKETGAPTSEKTHSLEAEVEEIQQQLKVSQAQNKELMDAVNESRNDLKRVLALLGSERESQSSSRSTSGESVFEVLIPGSSTENSTSERGKTQSPSQSEERGASSVRIEADTVPQELRPATELGKAEDISGVGEVGSRSPHELKPEDELELVPRHPDTEAGDLAERSGLESAAESELKLLGTDEAVDFQSLSASPRGEVVTVEETLTDPTSPDISFPLLSESPESDS